MIAFLLLHFLRDAHIGMSHGRFRRLAPQQKGCACVDSTVNSASSQHPQWGAEQCLGVYVSRGLMSSTGGRGNPNAAKELAWNAAYDQVSVSHATRGTSHA